MTRKRWPPHGCCSILKEDAEAPWAEYGTSGLTARVALQLLLKDYGITLGQHPLPRRHPGQRLRPQQVPRRLDPLLPHRSPDRAWGLTRIHRSHPSPRSSPPGRRPRPATSRPVTPPPPVPVLTSHATSGTSATANHPASRRPQSRPRLPSPSTTLETPLHDHPRTHRRPAASLARRVSGWDRAAILALGAAALRAVVRRPAADGHRHPHTRPADLPLPAGDRRVHRLRRPRPPRPAHRPAPRPPVRVDAVRHRHRRQHLGQRPARHPPQPAARGNRQSPARRHHRRRAVRPRTRSPWPEPSTSTSSSPAKPTPTQGATTTPSTSRHTRPPKHSRRIPCRRMTNRLLVVGASAARPAQNCPNSSTWHGRCSRRTETPPARRSATPSVPPAQHQRRPPHPDHDHPPHPLHSPDRGLTGTPRRPTPIRPRTVHGPQFQRTISRTNHGDSAEHRTTLADRPHGPASSAARADQATPETPLAIPEHATENADMHEARHETPPGPQQMIDNRSRSAASYRPRHSSPSGKASWPEPAPGVAGADQRRGAQVRKAATEGGPQPEERELATPRAPQAAVRVSARPERRPTSACT